MDHTPAVGISRSAGFSMFAICCPRWGCIFFVSTSHIRTLILIQCVSKLAFFYFAHSNRQNVLISRLFDNLLFSPVVRYAEKYTFAECNGLFYRALNKWVLVGCSPGKRKLSGFEQCVHLICNGC